MHLQATIAVALTILQVSGFNGRLIAGKICNPNNNSEVLAWNGTHLVFDGICLPPSTCYNFEHVAGFIFCSDLEAINYRVNGLPKKINRRNWIFGIGYTQPSSSYGHDEGPYGPEALWVVPGVVAFTVVIVLLCMFCGAYWA